MSVSVPAHVCECVCVCTRTHHIFFMHSSISGHLGCFHILIIVNNVTMNTRVHIFFKLVFLFFLVNTQSGILFYFNFLERKVLFIYLFNFIYFSIFGCAETASHCCTRAFSLKLSQAGATLLCHVSSSRCCGFHCCGAWALARQA